MSTAVRQQSPAQPGKVRKSVVENIRSIIARFPERELDIRRRCARDARFRSVCTDYEEAAAALRYWKKATREGDRKDEEYSNFLEELEAEILAQLDHPTANGRHS
jgi:hypothetical protein